MTCCVLCVFPLISLIKKGERHLVVGCPSLIVFTIRGNERGNNKDGNTKMALCERANVFSFSVFICLEERLRKY